MEPEKDTSPEAIEVTPEMVRAGMRELPPLLSERDDMEDAVIRIYRAMAMATGSSQDSG
jgi:hypothetical protein